MPSVGWTDQLPTEWSSRTYQKGLSEPSSPKALGQKHLVELQSLIWHQPIRCQFTVAFTQMEIVFSCHFWHAMARLEIIWLILGLLFPKKVLKWYVWIPYFFCTHKFVKHRLYKRPIFKGPFEGKKVHFRWKLMPSIDHIFPLLTPRNCPLWWIEGGEEHSG